MLPWLRHAKVLVGPRKAGDALEGATVRFRVWPNDLDMNRHMNNSRFLAMMDVGRYDLTRRTGLLQAVRRAGWFPVVAAQAIRFRKSLRPFATYELHTRVGGWDEKSFYLEQVFRKGGDVVAVAWVRARFLSKDGAVPVDAVMRAIGETRPSPGLPEDALMLGRFGN